MVHRFFLLLALCSLWLVSIAEAGILLRFDPNSTEAPSRCLRAGQSSEGGYQAQPGQVMLIAPSSAPWAQQKQAGLPDITKSQMRKAFAAVQAILRDPNDHITNYRWTGTGVRPLTNTQKAQLRQAVQDEINQMATYRTSIRTKLKSAQPLTDAEVDYIFGIPR